jgi:hypothetical protein
MYNEIEGDLKKQLTKYCNPKTPPGVP